MTRIRLQPVLWECGFRRAGKTFSPQLWKETLHGFSPSCIWATSPPPPLALLDELRHAGAVLAGEASDGEGRSGEPWGRVWAQGGAACRFRSFPACRWRPEVSKPQTCAGDQGADGCVPSPCAVAGLDAVGSVLGLARHPRPSLEPALSPDPHHAELVLWASGALGWPLGFSLTRMVA